MNEYHESVPEERQREIDDDLSSGEVGVLLRLVRLCLRALLCSRGLVVASEGGLLSEGEPGIQAQHGTQGTTALRGTRQTGQLCQMRGAQVLPRKERVLLRLMQL